MSFTHHLTNTPPYIQLYIIMSVTISLNASFFFKQLTNNFNNYFNRDNFEQTTQKEQLCHSRVIAKRKLHLIYKESDQGL